MRNFICLILITVIVFGGLTGCATAEFEVSPISISPSQVVAGEPAVAEVNVSNIGGADGVYSANLTVDGEVVEVQSKTITAGSTETIPFPCCFEDAGSHVVGIDGLTATVTALKPAEFEVTSVRIEPVEVAVGQEAIVEVDISNTGEVEGIYTATLKLNGIETDTKDITLAGGDADTVKFMVLKESAGSYAIDVGGVSSNFKVLKPAEFRVSSLEIKPVQAFAGQEVMVEAKISNTGEAEGTYTANLNVNGVAMDSKEITLSGGEQKSVSFIVLEDVAGKYDIELGELTKVLSVVNIETYRSPNFGYTISYPDGWELDSSNNAEVSMSDREGIHNVAVLTEIWPEEIPAAEAYPLLIAMLKTELNFTLLTESEIKDNGKVTGRQASFSVDAEGIKVRIEVLIKVSGKLGFIVLGGTDESLWEEYAPIYGAILNSFMPPEPEFVLPSPSPPAGYMGYADWENDFFIAYPEGWEIGDAPMTEGVQFTGPEDEGFYPNFQVAYSPSEGMTLEEYYESSREMMEMVFSGMKHISDKRIKINDIDAIEHIFTFQLTSGGQILTLKVFYVYIVHNDMAYLVGGGTTPSMFNRYEDIFDTVVQSFSILSLQVDQSGY